MNIYRTTKKISKRKNVSNSKVTTHQIGHWTIQESLEPFPQKENNLLSIKQLIPNKSNVHQWSIDDVCLFVEYILDDNHYTSIIQEHLIDGIAFLLLKEEHLTKIFQMPLKQQNKLLYQIHQF